MWTCPNCDAQTDDGFDICWTCRTSNGQHSVDATSRQDFIVSTTETLETHDIVEYFWPVFGETVWGANILRDFAASFTDAFGGAI
jgi:Putative heavy-metal-binding